MRFSGMSTSWRRLAEVARDRVLGGGGRRRRIERRNREQLVDRRRLGLLLDESVALRQRHDLVGADALDEVIEVLADACLRARAVWRLQQHVDGEIERRSRLLEMAQAQLALAGGEMALRLGDQVGDWVVNRGRLGLAHLHDRGAGGVTVTWTGFWPPPHPTIDTLTPIAAATGSKVRKLISLSYKTFRPRRDRTDRDERKPSGSCLGEAVKPKSVTRRSAIGQPLSPTTSPITGM